MNLQPALAIVNKPNFLNRFMKKLARDRLLQTFNPG
jgi:hypothetical protein